jgi:hypothetical protein
MKYLFTILLMFVGCAAPRQYVSLPPFPETCTDYAYLIKLPEGTTGVAIFWYYGIEANTHMIYTSGPRQIHCCNIQTEMYFPKTGVYILTVWYERNGRMVEGDDVMRRKYTVRENWNTNLQCKLN